MQVDLKPGEPVRVYWNSTYIDIEVVSSDEARNTSYLVMRSPGKRMRSAGRSRPLLWRSWCSH